MTNTIIRKLLWTALTFSALLSTQANAACMFWQDCDAYKTKHPIVLVHGVAGFDSILGIDYFYGVHSALKERGAEVYSPNLSAWEDAYVRGEQLVTYLEDLQAATGAEKFNLTGHSLGGPTVRYAAGVRPDLVASVTTISAVNFGSEFADVARGLVPMGGNTEAFIAQALELMGHITDFLAGNPENPQDALDSVTFMTTAGAAEFNKKFPDGMPSSSCGQGAQEVNGVHYYSWGGNDAVTNVFDISDAFLMLTSTGISGNNDDGLVGQCSQHWGKVIGTDYSLNHLDAINHLFGIHHLFETDPVTLYENHAVRLKTAGL